LPWAISANRSGRGFDPREGAGLARSGSHGAAMAGPRFAVVRLLALRMKLSALELQRLGTTTSR
jgi:hypothetical protein